MVRSWLVQEKRTGTLMAPSIDRIEKFFENLALTVYTNRLKVLAGVFILLAIILYKLPDLTVDTSAEALLHEKDPSRVAYDHFRDQFGQDRFIVVTITSDHIFTPDFFLRLKSFQKELERDVPYIKEVTSLINARNTRGEDDRLIVEDLMDGWPSEKNVDFEELKKQVLSNPTYINQYISTDGRTTAVVLEPDVYHTEVSDTLEAIDNFDEEMLQEGEDAGEGAAPKKRYLSYEENTAAVKAIKKIIKKYEGPDFRTALAGGPVVLKIFNDYTMKDMKKCLFLNLIVILIFLALFFHRITGLLLPTIIVNAAAFSSLGLMGWFGVPVKMTTTVLPAFLLCVGVADSVHILALFYKEYDRGTGKKDAVVHALGHSGLAVVLTSLTTVAGLLSFSFAELTALGDLGLFASAGVILALLLTIVMLPAMLALTPVKRKTPPEERKGGMTVMDRLLLWNAGISIRHPLKIICISLVLFAISFYYIFNLRYSDYVLGYFPQTLAVRNDIDFIDKHLNGVMRMEVVIDTHKENGVYEPRFLNRIEQASRYLSHYRTADIFVGKVYSINDILKEINQALHENKKEFYRIPQDYNTIAQEFLLFENSGSDDLEPIVDSRFSKTRFSIKVNWVDSVIFNRFMHEIHNYFQNLFPEDTGVTITITGMSALMARSISAALDSMTKSYGLAFVVIAIMMIFLVWHIKTGLFSMIPNVLPIVLSLGIMGLFKVPLDITSLMIASIAMGLVVDDTVHFVYNFRKFYLRTGDANEAIRITFLGVGRAMFITSVVLSLGFFSLMLATLTHIIRFGFFTGLTIIFALLADFLLAPAIMIVISGSHAWQNRKKEKMAASVPRDVTA